MKRVVDIDPLKNSRKFNYTGFLPQDLLDKQRVIDVRYYPNEPEVFSLNGATFYKFSLNRSTPRPDKNRIRVIVEYDLELFNYDLEKAKFYKTSLVDTLEIRKYLSTERYQSSIRQIEKETKGQIDESLNDEQKARSIFNFVTQRLEHDSQITQILTPSEVLRTGQGDCTEYSDLFVSICRFYGIPARLIGGTLLSAPHVWAEIYLAKYGWVPMDPTLADKYDEVTFDNLAHDYIYISSGRSELLENEQVNSSKITWEDAMSFNSDKCSYTADKSRMDVMKTAAHYYNKSKLDTASFLVTTLLASDVENTKYLTLKGGILARQNKFDQASILFQAAFRFSNHSFQKQEAYYGYSKFLSLKGDLENSLKYLRASLELGFQNFEHIRSDIDLKNLRSTKEFDQLMDEFTQ